MLDCRIAYRVNGQQGEAGYAVQAVEAHADGGISLLLPFVDAVTNKQDRVYLNPETVRAILEARGTAGFDLNPLTTEGK
jgi:hypothetical protein